MSSDQVKGLSSHQKKLFDIVHKYFNDLGPVKNRNANCSNQLYLHIQGGAGSGKTHMLKSIIDLARVKEMGHIVFTAYTGIAASLLGGTTLISTFSIPTFDEKKGPVLISKLSDTKLVEMTEFIKAKELCAVVIDEVSTVTPLCLAFVDSRLKQAMKNERPFGGVAIILVGDFTQLPPVGTKLYEGALETALRKERSSSNTEQMHGRKKGNMSSKEAKCLVNQDHGVELFNKFLLIQLKGQQRSKNDPVQTALVKKMTEEKSLQMSDIKKLKTLSKIDIENDEEWRSAPILVTSNRERIALTAQSAPMFAELKNQHVIRWPLKRKKWSNKPHLDLFPEVEDDPALWGYFVRGAPGYITHNINPTIKMSNGTPVQFNSLFYNNKKQQQDLEDKIKSTPLGEVITMSTPP